MMCDHASFQHLGWRDGFARAFFLPACLAAGLLSFRAGTSQPAPITLSSAEELRHVPPRQGTIDWPVLLTGTVTYHDPELAFLFVQDETGGALVRLPRSTLAFAAGQVVTVEGKLGLEEAGACVQNARVTSQGENPLPESTKATIMELKRPPFQFLRVEVRGVVSAVEMRSGKPVLHLHSGTNHIDVVVQEDTHPARFRSLMAASVRVRGVNVKWTDRDASRPQRRILCLGWDDIVIEQPGLTNPFGTESVRIEQVRNHPMERPVKISGRALSELEDDRILVADGSGRIEVRTGQRVITRPGDPIEVIGFPGRHKGVPILEHGAVRVMGRRRPVPRPAAGPDAEPDSQDVALIQSVAEIRGLTPEEAIIGRPVRVRGVVTYYSPERKQVFVQEGGSGILVEPSGKTLSLRPGQIVEVKGFTSPGDYAPTIVDAVIHAEAAGQLPLARVPSYEELNSGQVDCKWVHIDGVVRHHVTREGHLVLKLEVNGGDMEVIVSGPLDPQWAARLPDSAVRIHGVSTAKFNERRQLVGVSLLCPGKRQIEITRESPEDAFTRNAVPIDRLFQFNPGTRPGHRAKVAGVVTLPRDAEAFYLKDDFAPVLVELARPETVVPGERVEVVGFPGVRIHTPVLEDAIRTRSFGELERMSFPSRWSLRRRMRRAGVTTQTSCSWRRMYSILLIGPPLRCCCCVARNTCWRRPRPIRTLQRAGKSWCRGRRCGSREYASASGNGTAPVVFDFWSRAPVGLS
jgi:two-component system, cell cycle sensor histidine kinase and response regulator CckA